MQRAACSVALCVACWAAAAGRGVAGIVQRAACSVQRGLVCGEVRKWSSLLPLVPAAGLVLK